MHGSPGSAPPLLRPMEIGEILDQTFKLYRRSWKTLSILGLITAIPNVLLQGLQQQSLVGLESEDVTSNFFFRMIMSIDEGNLAPLFAGAGFLLLYLIGLWLLGAWVQGAVVAVCSRTVLQQPISAGEALRISGRRYGAFLGTSLLKGLFYLLAFPALIIGGLLIFAILTLPIGYPLLTAAMIFTTHVILVEGVSGGWPAIKRSFSLFTSRFWPLLGLGIIFSLLAGVFSAVLTFPTSIIVTIFRNTGTAWLAALVTGLAPVITVPFTTVGLTLAYYDVRMRKEGFDLEMLANSQLANPEQP